MALALNDQHDVYLGPRNGIAIARAGAAVAQGILTRLRLFRGEWYLNTVAGTPWFQDVFVAHPDQRRIESKLKEQILSVPGVEGITSFELSFDAGTREASITFEVDTIYGPSGVLEVAL